MVSSCGAGLALHADAVDFALLHLLSLLDGQRVAPHCLLAGAEDLRSVEVFGLVGGVRGVALHLLVQDHPLETRASAAVLNHRGVVVVGRLGSGRLVVHRRRARSLAV